MTIATLIEHLRIDDPGHILQKVRAAFMFGQSRVDTQGGQNRATVL
jgi:hypothetical protein